MLIFCAAPSNQAGGAGAAVAAAARSIGRNALRCKLFLQSPVMARIVKNLSRDFERSSKRMPPSP
jgi:hypothetical protein